MRPSPGYRDVAHNYSNINGDSHRWEDLGWARIKYEEAPSGMAGLFNDSRLQIENGP